MVGGRASTLLMKRQRLVVGLGGVAVELGRDRAENERERQAMTNGYAGTGHVCTTGGRFLAVVGDKLGRSSRQQTTTTMTTTSTQRRRLWVAGTRDSISSTGRESGAEVIEQGPGWPQSIWLDLGNRGACVVMGWPFGQLGS